MSLNFYCDPGLTVETTQATPKRFLVSSFGDTRLSQVWVGDPYVSYCAVQANPGDTEIGLVDTGEFFDATQIATTSGGIATARSGDQTFTYTGKTQSSLTGVSGITSVIKVQDVVYPDIIYYTYADGDLEMFPIGPDFQNFRLQLALGATAILGFPGLPALYTQKSIAIGIGNAVPVFVGLTVPAGVDQEFTNFSIQTTNLYKRDIADTTPIGITEAGLAPNAYMYCYRHNQGLPMPIRVLPANRQVFPSLPGFVFGEYKWRGENNRNALPLVPTVWDQDPNIVGLGKYVAGIGDSSDLAPTQLVQDGNSIRMQVERGQYFTGANRYYLPADPVLEFVPCSAANMNSDGTVTIPLKQIPRKDGAPIFVGTWILDNQQYYEKSIEYLYQATLLNPDGSMRTDLPEFYYILDRHSNTITLNKPIEAAGVIMFLGAISGQPKDYYNVPVYPVDNVLIIYVNRGADVDKLYANIWDFDRENGTLVVPSIAGALPNEALFAIASPAVAVLYDTGPDEVFQVETVDFNPAFSGLASGYFYLQQRVQAPTSLILACDKPMIPIPATQASIIGLVAFGPVYYTNDYALLSVTAYGPLNGEKVPNAVLNVVVDPATFTGTINYQDPVIEQVTVITGGDGTANLVFIPAPEHGLYMPTTQAIGSNGAWVLGGVATTNIANDTLILPEDLDLSQIWNNQEGWLVTTYTIADNDPLFGMIGADPSQGEIPWITTGFPGLPDYQTNGEIDAWRQGNTSVGNLVVPIDALDFNGNSFTSNAFNGTVRQLVYSTAVPANDSITSNIGAYFITFIQRVLIQIQLANSNVVSNIVLIQMAQPNVIVGDPWLILNDSVQGVLNQRRLGYVDQR